MFPIRSLATICTVLVFTLAITTAHAQAQSLELIVEPNQTGYVPGDVLRVKFITNAATPQDQLDLYAGLILGDGRTTMFFSSLAPPVWQGADLGSNAAAFVPLHTALQVAAGKMNLSSTLTVDIPPTTPLGSYNILFAATRTASLEDGSVDANDLVTYTEAPLTLTAPPLAHAASTYTPYRALAPQTIATGSLYVTGSLQVQSGALAEARRQLDTMLRFRPDIVAKLRTSGALIGVFAETENVCSLPYFADLSGQAICTDAAGGLGGVPGREASGCSERSLLKLASDPFGRGTRQDGENTCLHEMAHLIMNVGLEDTDRQRIHTEYARAKAAGIWGTDYIMTNADEYFAEITQAYFCANPEIPAFNHLQGVNCPFSLEAHDPLSFDLIDSIFLGSSDLR